MAIIAVWLKVDEERVVQSLQEAGEKLDGVAGEITLDFSAVRRIDSGALVAWQSWQNIAEDKEIKIVFRGLNVDIYKVLKLVKLASRFSFGN